MALAAIWLASCGFTHANIGSPATRLSGLSTTLGTVKSLAGQRREKMFLVGQLLLPRAAQRRESTAAKHAMNLERSRLRDIPSSLNSMASLDRVKRPALAERALSRQSRSHPEWRLTEFFRNFKVFWARAQQPPRKQR